MSSRLASATQRDPAKEEREKEEEKEGGREGAEEEEQCGPWPGSELYPSW